MAEIDFVVSLRSVSYRITKMLFCLECCFYVESAARLERKSFFAGAHVVFNLKTVLQKRLGAEGGIAAQIIIVGKICDKCLLFRKKTVILHLE